MLRILGTFVSQEVSGQTRNAVGQANFAWEQKSVNLNHSTLPEIKDFNALSDTLKSRLNQFRSRAEIGKSEPLNAA
ncbi:MAG: hypothetical protein AB3N23_02125 [Paracoccaceae bacterium]